MSRTYYHRHHRKPWKCPPYIRRLVQTKPNRQQVRAILQKLPVELIDTSVVPNLCSKTERGWYW